MAARPGPQRVLLALGPKGTGPSDQGGPRARSMRQPPPQRAPQWPLPGAAAQARCAAAADLCHRHLGPLHGVCRGHGRYLREFDELRQPGGEACPPLVQSRFDGPRRDAKLAGHLAVRQPLQVEQHHRVALTVGQRGDRRSHPGREIGDLGDLRRARGRRRLVGRQAGHLQPELAQPPARHVEGDPAKPGAEPFRGTQSPKIGHGRDRRFLSRVTRQIHRAQDPGSQADRRIPVPLQQLSERLPRPQQRVVHQISI